MTKAEQAHCRTSDHSRYTARPQHNDFITAGSLNHQGHHGVIAGSMIAYLLQKAPFQDLKDWDHHDWEGKQQTQAQRQLDGNSGPVSWQVQSDDVSGLLSKGCIPNLHQHSNDAHDADYELTTS